MPLTTIAGSLPGPRWLAEPERLQAPWRLPADRSAGALVALGEQEAAGICRDRARPGRGELGGH